MSEALLSPKLVEALAAQGSTRTFRANAIVIHEGDAGEALYIVLTGRLRAYASAEDGREEAWLCRMSTVAWSTS